MTHTAQPPPTTQIGSFRGAARCFLPFSVAFQVHFSAQCVKMDKNSTKNLTHFSEILG